MAVAEFLPKSIYKNESFLNEEVLLDEKDPIIYSNPIDKKCGEIILHANTKFMFLCTFCNEHFHSIGLFRNHILDIHITEDGENVRNSEDGNPLDLHPSEKFILEMDVDENSYVHFGDDEVKNNKETDIEEFKLENFNKEDTINRSESNGIEEMIPTKTIKIEKRSKYCEISEDSEDEDVTYTKNPRKKAKVSSDIDDFEPAAESKKSPKKRQKKIHSCSYCGHIAPYKKALERHLQKNHDAGTRYQCEECGKCFGDKSNLTSHLVIHTGTRPYKCDFCDAGFSHSNSLKAHRYIHTGNRPFKCDQCDKAFVSNGALKVHIREHTGETPYVCQICKKGFAAQCSYKRHMISHSGERAYQCPHCGKAFIHKGELTNHLMCHSTEKQFACDICSKKFGNKKNLAQHKKLHLNIKQYVCKVCNKEFAQHAGLYSHMKHHKNNEEKTD